MPKFENGSLGDENEHIVGNVSAASILDHEIARQEVIANTSKSIRERDAAKLEIKKLMAAKEKIAIDAAAASAGRAEARRQKVAKALTEKPTITFNGDAKKNIAEAEAQAINDQYDQNSAIDRVWQGPAIGKIS
jgi:hypothetical protein